MAQQIQHIARIDAPVTVDISGDIGADLRAVSNIKQRQRLSCLVIVHVNAVCVVLIAALIEADGDRIHTVGGGIFDLERQDRQRTGRCAVLGSAVPCQHIRIRRELLRFRVLRAGYLVLDLRQRHDVRIIADHKAQVREAGILVQHEAHLHGVAGSRADRVEADGHNAIGCGLDRDGAARRKAAVGGRGGDRRRPGLLAENCPVRKHRRNIHIRRGPGDRLVLCPLRQNGRDQFLRFSKRQCQGFVF